MKTLQDRFWSKVDKNGPWRIPMREQCWAWTGTTSLGYGKFDKQWAHRVAYELCIGRIPNKLQLDHVCRVRMCVNPSHLEPVTHAENIRRGTAGRVNNNQSQKTQCPRGHEYSADNTRVYNGSRSCLACKNQKQRARRNLAKPIRRKYVVRKNKGKRSGHCDLGAVL